MGGMTRGRSKIARALKLLDEAAAERRAELISLLNNEYAALKAVIMKSGHGPAHAFEQGRTRAVEAAEETGDLAFERVVEAYEHVHRN